ncbi:alpha-(1,3)-fucosyltransferase C-like [Achroia grisella]|uniref:alpha-(1,3)-fucosyltransferase C-like n=1 Tax=Achroia grisella TaxID=688607 RepID=UPI0027D287A3|nr:alpha-(1,3)-fucosyltransferase C-like [Achroia grisella]
MKYLRHKRIMYTYYIKDMIFVATCRMTLIRIIFCASVFLVAIIISLIPAIVNINHQQLERSVRYPTDIKYILFWSPPKDKKRMYFLKEGTEFNSGQSSFIQQKCPFINCYVTYNRSFLTDLNNFDAVVFNVKDLSKIRIEDLTVARSPHQKYIFRSQESSENYPVCNSMYDNFFNLTWTYKLNSDIPQPFINIYDASNKLIGPKKNIHWITKMNHTDKFKNKITNKNKAVSWIVTKCNSKSKHQDFVREFRSELEGYNHTIDTFGPCTENKCPDGKIHTCHKLIEKHYFFQLILENSFAEDYVTEKIVKSLMHFTIPIVLGGADYTRFLPPGSYINVQKFGLKKLGALIDYLIKNPQMYEYFFDWKNHYFYSARPTFQVCDLCTKLNLNNSIVVRRYKNFRKWWNPDFKDTCRRMQLQSIFNTQ